MAISKVNALMTSVTNLMASRAMQAGQKLNAEVQESSAQSRSEITQRADVQQHGSSQAFQVNISKGGMQKAQGMHAPGQQS